MKVELAGISKIYRRKRALHQVRLDLKPGRIVAAVGLNGAGKTTLLHCLAGILYLNEGEIYFDEEPFSRERVDQRKRFAFLPDFPIFFPWMTALEHIGLALRLFERDEPGAEERVLELLRAFDLMPVAAVPLRTLSRGQIYKAALTALLAVEPEMMLLDEPMASGMDASGLNQFRERARAAARAGAIVVYTTQILAVAEQFSDEVIVLHEGRVHAHGPVASLDRNGSLEAVFAALREPA